MVPSQDSSMMASAGGLPVASPINRPLGLPCRSVPCRSARDHISTLGSVGYEAPRMEARWYGRARGQETHPWLPWRGDCRHQGSAWLGMDQVSRRSAWAFLIFLSSRPSLRGSGLPSLPGRSAWAGLESDRPKTCTGFDPRVSKRSRTAGGVGNERAVLDVRVLLADQPCLFVPGPPGSVYPRPAGVPPFCPTSCVRNVVNCPFGLTSM